MLGNIQQVKLQSNDGHEFDVPVQVACISKTVMTMLENQGPLKGDEGPIHLHNVNGDILRRVIEWATYHKDDPLSEEETRTDDISAWDANFFNVDQRTLCELMLAAYDLDIITLYLETCTALASGEV